MCSAPSPGQWNGLVEVSLIATTQIVESDYVWGLLGQALNGLGNELATPDTAVPDQSRADKHVVCLVGHHQDA